jgi:polysaccharide biosynthesis protein PslF
VITFGVLSTVPPARCGIATFSEALVRHLNDDRSRSSAELVPIASHAPAAALNRCDVAVVQHEYGIYDGPDGEAVLDVLQRIRVPIVVVLHTVLTTPTIWQRTLLSRMCHLADAVVVLSQTAATRLIEGYGIDGRRVTVIPHGAEAGNASRRVDNPSHPLLLTWGLLGPGKGIEWVIDALAEVGDLPNVPRYLVAGQTHPRVLARQGEAYRDSLRERAAARGVAHLVEFDAAYRSRRDLAALVASADTVVLPYDSSEQVASGVLTEAVAARRPIIATRFPHAAELLADGAGLLVPHADSRAVGVAIRRVLTEPGLAESMRWRAAQIAPTLDWAAVADRYRLLGTRLTSARARRLEQPGPAGHGRPRIGRRTTVG